MRLFLRLAWRNVWRHRRRTLIVILAMGLGLSLMMMYDGLVAGFNQASAPDGMKIKFSRSKTLMQGDDCCDQSYSEPSGP